MRTNIVCYSLKASPTTRTKLHRELYGYKDHSNHGKYAYERSGLLKATQSRRITDAVILIAQQRTRKLIDLLHKYGAKTYIFEIVDRVRH